MNELRDILHQRHHDMAASLRHAPEFDETAAVRSVRSHRRGRAIVMGSSSLATVTVLAAGAWLLLTHGQPDVAPAITPSPSVSASPTPEASASETASPEPVSYEGRNPGMSDGEAYYRAEHPATGEVWLPEPVEVEAPDALSEYGAERWWHVGDRDDAAILVPTGFYVELAIVEVAYDGTATEVAAPLPSDPAPSGSTRTGLPASEVYYDSMALPATFTGPDGLTMNPRESGRLVLSFNGGFEGPGYEQVASVGASEVVRSGSKWDWSYESYFTQFDDYDPESPDVVAARAVDSVVLDRIESVNYFLEHPFGFGVEISLDPLATDGLRNDDRHYLDLMDRACGGVYEYGALDSQADPADWTEVGGSNGIPWYAPTVDNDLAHAFYDFAATNTLGWLADAGVRSFEDYLEQRMMLGTPAADGYGWWVTVRSEGSIRQGC
ncbi:hypothetical protein [Demequina rhizosphaerae]|uniref:hypothetical protein n=1 Tax=Demequina rhizosphaerae TaxID=1638985 RepID=UPI0007810EAD|nr:hypothetical protein [Demequina rhizosphaerae]